MDKQQYIFLSEGDTMQDGDEFIEPWFTWSPIPRHNIGGKVTKKSAPRVRRPVNKEEAK